MKSEYCINVRVSNELHEALRKCALENGRSVSRQVIWLLCLALQINYKETETKIKGK